MRDINIWKFHILNPPLPLPHTRTIFFSGIEPNFIPTKSHALWVRHKAQHYFSRFTCIIKFKCIIKMISCIICYMAF